MKINDFIYRYPSTSIRGRDGICRIRTFVNNNEVFALVTDIGSKNTSASVTNSIETIYESLVKNEMLPQNCLIIEHYEPNGFLNTHDCDFVTVGKDITTKWDSIESSRALQMLGCDRSEFDNLTINNNRLLIDIEKLRSIIDPHLDLPYQQNPEIINRRIVIEDGMISKEALSELISNGAKEQELQGFLKKDMSIIAELYSKPSDSYISFSEFPLNGGFVDFVLFTGVSRMDVFLIEIKGADFNLFNQSGYQDFNSKMDYALKQLRDRLGYINRNLSDFRKHVHEIHSSVLSGLNYANSFIGPDRALLVDKDKDVNIHCIAIGGRTINDLEESRKRHDFETNFKYPIKVESWDTLLRKLRRK